ncbi:MAG: hypothetical protein QXJ68_02800 [Methanocellales archaeon]
MRLSQILLIFLIFFIVMLLITIPLWQDFLLPKIELVIERIAKILGI